MVKIERTALANAEGASSAYCAPGEGGFGSGHDCPANEAIFESVRGNKKAEAVLDTLALGEVVSTKKLHSQGSETWVLTINYEGVESKALFKLGGMGVDRELAAVALSQTLGFRVTPLGLLRTVTINNEKYTGYIQQWIPGKSLAQVQVPEALLFQDEHYQRHNLIVLFDHLIGNWDRGSAAAIRNSGNWLLSDDEMLYAIDHGHADFRATDHFTKEDILRDKQIPLSAASAIIAMAKRPSRIKRLLREFSFIRSTDQKGLEKRFQAIAASIEIREAGAFINTDILFK